jgi:beta-glucosidase
VLTGVVNPSDRLAETIPHRLEDNSSYLNFPGDSQVVRYGEGLFIGYRGYEICRQDVAFPFGFGLSYTSFALSGLQVATRGSVAEGNLEATVTVTVSNTGAVDGGGGAGLRPGCGVERGPSGPGADGVRQSVRGRGNLPAGVDRAGSAGVRVLVDRAPRLGGRGGRLRDRRRLELPGPPADRNHHRRGARLAAPLNRDSTLQEWMSDPIGKQLIESEVKNGQPAVVLEEELFSVIGNMPMSTLANFGGMSLDHDALDRVADSWRQQADVT